MPQPGKYPNNAARQAAYRQRCRQAAKEQARKRGLPPLPALPPLPGSARWRAALALAQRLLEEVCSQMQTYFEQRSETWQESERGQDFIQRLQELEEVCEQMETLL